MYLNSSHAESGRREPSSSFWNEACGLAACDRACGTRSHGLVKFLTAGLVLQISLPSDHSNPPAPHRRTRQAPREGGYTQAAGPASCAHHHQMMPSTRFQSTLRSSMTKTSERAGRYRNARSAMHRSLVLFCRPSKAAIIIFFQACSCCSSGCTMPAWFGISPPSKASYIGNAGGHSKHNSETRWRNS